MDQSNKGNLTVSLFIWKFVTFMSFYMRWSHRESRIIHVLNSPIIQLLSYDFLILKSSHWETIFHQRSSNTKQQISCETAAYMRPLTSPTHNFEVAILKLELDILDLEIGILNIEFDKL